MNHPKERNEFGLDKDNALDVQKRECQENDARDDNCGRLTGGVRIDDVCSSEHTQQ